MKRKFALTSVVSSLIVLIVVAQVVHVYAQNGDEPITGPVTEPITSPVTPTPTESPSPTPTVSPSETPLPTESPSSSPTPTLVMHNLSGTVTLRMFRSRPKPEAGVAVTAENLFHGGLTTTMTDQNGNYAMLLPSGLYLVQPADAKNNLFVPVLRFIRLTTDHTANFRGISFDFGPNFPFNF